LIEKFQAGYVAGATMVAPKIKVLVAYLTEPPDYSGFGNPAKAGVAAEGMYMNGADVVYHAAGGSGGGVFQAAKAVGALAIGVDSDEYMTAPPDTKAYILTSMLKRVDVAVNAYGNAHARRALPGGVMTFDLANGGVGYSKSNPLAQPYVATAEGLREQIVAGKISVPDRP
jgi:basic membrane protein A